MNQPVFIFVPGAWHGPECFSSISDLLFKQGFQSQGINLPSVGSTQLLSNFDADVNVIRKTTADVLATGKDVVLVMHSYGASPGSEAMKGFMDDNDGKNGMGKIVRMVWLCAFVLPVGGSLMAGLGHKNLPWFIIEGDVVNPAGPEEVFYNDLPAAEAARWSRALKPHSYSTFKSTTTVEPWQTIPSAYLFCENDNAIPIQAQQAMVAMAKQKAPKSFDMVQWCVSGHSPFLSKPDAVADFLIDAATK